MKNLKDIKYIISMVAELRNDRWDHKQFDWPENVRQFQHERCFANVFKNHSIPSYDKLDRILHPILERVELIIIVQNHSYLGTLLLLDFVGLQKVPQETIDILVGVPWLLYMMCLITFVGAVNSAPQLDIHLLQTHQE